MIRQSWRTSVTDLLTIFRGALLSIIPWLEKARIKWKEGEAYDDWDNIAKALYENIVCSSLQGQVLSEYPIARYDFIYDSYSDLDYVKVKSEEHSNKKLAFVSFQTKYLPFDIVKVAILDKRDQVSGYLSVRQSDVKYLFVRNKAGKRKITDEVTVML